jgi:hypothetical protein
MLWDNADGKFSLLVEDPSIYFFVYIDISIYLSSVDEKRTG